MKQYVQHKSGQGEKWEVLLERHTYWICKDTIVLPKSEYIPCDPPEEWEDVTDWFGANDICLHPSIGNTGLHIRKIDGLHNGHAFIIERLKK